MHLGSLLMVSALLILIGTMVIAILFAVTDRTSTLFALILSTVTSAIIAAFNYLMMPYGSASGKALALSMGAIAVLVAFIFKERPKWAAKITISGTILIGLTQLIALH